MAQQHFEASFQIMKRHRTKHLDRFMHALPLTPVVQRDWIISCSQKPVVSCVGSFVCVRQSFNWSLTISALSYLNRKSALAWALQCKKNTSFTVKQHFFLLLGINSIRSVYGTHGRPLERSLFSSLSVWVESATVLKSAKKTKLYLWMKKGTFELNSLGIFI